MAVLEDLSDEECYLLAILTDHSGLDLAEFTWHEPDEPTGSWRAWPFQWKWFRDSSPLQIDQCARSVGKTTSITLRMFAFPFLFPGQEAVVTAPELVHLEPLTNLIERKFYDTRLGREMLPRGRSAVTHRPFMMNFVNGSRIIGRIPQRDGKGVKGCASVEEMIWTSEGYKRAGDIQVGDRVLTHEGRYMPVTEVHPDVNDCYEVTGAGSFPMTVSCDHRFLGSENTGTPKTKRSMLPLAWHDVEFLTEHQVYWATPTTFPALPVPGCNDWDQSKDSFWWLVGRYLADGWCDPRRTLWVGPDWKIAAIEAVLDEHGKTHHRTAQRSGSLAERVVISGVAFSAWLDDNFGRLAGGKRLPAWALGMDGPQRKALLDGYLAGDGFWNDAKNRWEVGTASKELAMGVQLLAQSLGWTVNCTSAQPKVTAIAGVALKQQPQVSWRLQIGHGHSMQMDDHLVGKVKSVVPVGKQPIVNIVVADDHSYLSGSIMSHNIHPIWLELDEAQDFPEAGWTELIETLKRGHEGAVWRAHGVTRGMRDKFYEYTQDTPDNQWKVHRITAMSRPNWTDQERQEKIQQYKTRDNPDYRRNVLGLHGDATNPLFVLHRLMKVVDEDLSSEYNADTYQQLRISTEMLNDRGVKHHIAEFLSCPPAHRGFKAYWAGMDVGYTKDPSEILIFGEEQKAGKTLIRLLSRIHLERIEAPIQAEVVSWIFDIYNPRRFAMDKTGNGLPLFQDLQHNHPNVAEQITGYNFSEKILVDFDEAMLAAMKEGGDEVKEAGIVKSVLEYSTDKLRELVDKEQIQLPWDTELIGEFQGQTWTYSKSSMDIYGRPRRVFSQGTFHGLDAARMAALGFCNYKLEEMMRLKAQQDSRPVLDYVMDSWL